MRLMFLIGSLAATGTVIHSTAAFAQSAPSDRCETAVLYDSVDGLFRMEQGEGTPQSVYPELSGADFTATKPHLSPDGRTLAWVRYPRDPEIGPAIWLLNIESGAQQILVPDMNTDQPAWSPDGTRIAFTSWKSRTGGLIGDLYVIEVESGNLHRLSDNEFRDEFATWSPDGVHIAFGSIRNGNFDIFVIRSDGSDLRRITTHPATDFRPAWSPDGRSLAFSSSRHAYRDADNFKYDIYVMRVDGGEPRRITQHALLALRPSWSPSGNTLVYQVGGAAADGSDWEIYTVDVDGGEPQRLTDNAVQDAHPDWNTFQLDCRSR